MRTMNDSNEDSPRNYVLADINYFPALGTPIPTSAWKAPILGDRTASTRSMKIHDIRRCPQNFTLDINGFEFVTLPPKPRITASDTEEIIQQDYYPEMEDVIKKLTKATTVHIFNHVIRSHTSPSSKGIQDAYGRWQEIPSAHPHVDYSGEPSHIAGTLQELKLPPHISGLFATSPRFAFLNAWRPLKPVLRDPLAVCDALSVPDQDYQVRLRKFSRTGIESGNYVMSHGQDEDVHMWYYMSDMQPNEMVVFKGLDTCREGKGWRCAHSAFELEGAEGEEARESVEVRVVCFWE